MPDGLAATSSTRSTSTTGRSRSSTRTTGALRRMAVFDVVVNNADRKGGHVLAMPDGHRYGVDHGVCFHAEHKLRTVLWGWAGEPLDRRGDRAGVRRCSRRGWTTTTRCGTGSRSCSPPSEVARTRGTAAGGCCDRRRLPVPSGTWPSIPWPAF